jgi:hypothetical protein
MVEETDGGLPYSNVVVSWLNVPCTPLPCGATTNERAAGSEGPDGTDAIVGGLDGPVTTAIVEVLAPHEATRVNGRTPVRSGCKTSNEIPVEIHQVQFIL